MIKKFLNPGTNPFATNVALLVLRVWLGATLALAHGISKLTSFEKLRGGFPDPLGVGSVTSLSMTIFAEVVCALLIVIGLFTRFAAFVQVILMTVAFGVIHKMALKGENSGELAFLYLAGFIVILIAGPGAYSADQAISGGATPRKGAK